MYLLKIGYSRITPQILTDLDKILQAYVGRTQISRIKTLATWAKGAQNGSEKMDVFVTGIMNLFFFVHNATAERHEILAKRQVVSYMEHY